MRRSLIILALVFLLAGCPKDNDSTSGGTGSATGVEVTNGDIYIDGGENGSRQAAVVPEPATLVLFSLGAAGFAALQLRRKKNG